MTLPQPARIAIYDAWLGTLGGGEKHILAFARALAEQHEVHFFSHSHVDPDRIGFLLSETLNNIRFFCIPLSPDLQLSSQFSSYDLFINASHDSVLPRPAPHGLRFLFFPPSPPPRLPTLLARALHPAHRIVGLPVFGPGFYGPERIGNTWYCATGARADLRMPGATGGGRSLSLMVGNPGADPAGKPLRILAGDQVLHEANIPPTGGDFIPVGPIPLPPTSQDSLSITLITETDDPEDVPDPLENRSLGLLVADPRTDAFLQSPVRILTRRLFPDLAVAVQRALTFPGRAALGSYDAIVANSAYTADWVERWWGLPAVAIHPPVAPVPATAQSTRPEILSVGRFFAGSHNKNHDHMVRWFGRLVAAGLRGWTLRLIGALGSHPDDRAYLQRVRDLARGLPVEIHVDAPAAVLADAYNRASIYWHAAGYGCHPRRHPERFEHFGISTVEAMSAGAVPLVFAGGGLRETVEPGISGYTWRNEAGLAEHTWRLVRDARLRRLLAAAAIVRSREFSPARFESRIMAVVDALP
ncbi:MAG: glycosyltransferase [Chloroflexota bacterium]|nr:glycosyltransferase [Chloroflexota bacterium]